MVPWGTGNRKAGEQEVSGNRGPEIMRGTRIRGTQGTGGTQGTRGTQGHVGDLRGIGIKGTQGRGRKKEIGEPRE